MAIKDGKVAEIGQNLAATGATEIDATGKVVATDTRHTLGAAAKLELTIDAPSKATGTGTCHPLLPPPRPRLPDR